jgi:hypothetical protein
MNKFEFDNLKETPSNGLGKICRWLVLAILLTSTDLAAVPWWATRVAKTVQAARQDAAAANVATNAAFAAAAQQKQEAKTDGGWEDAFDAVQPGQRSR